MNLRRAPRLEQHAAADRERPGGRRDVARVVFVSPAALGSAEVAIKLKKQLQLGWWNIEAVTLCRSAACHVGGP